MSIGLIYLIGLIIILPPLLARNHPGCKREFFSENTPPVPLRGILAVAIFYPIVITCLLINRLYGVLDGK